MTAFFNGSLSADKVAEKLVQTGRTLRDVGLHEEAVKYEELADKFFERGEWPSPQASARRGGQRG